MAGEETNEKTLARDEATNTSDVEIKRRSLLTAFTLSSSRQQEMTLEATSSYADFFFYFIRFQVSFLIKDDFLPLLNFLGRI